MAGWRFIVTDTAGVGLGELRNAADRRVAFGVNRNASAGWRLRGDHPLADTLLAGASLVKVYDGVGVDPVFVGRVIASEEVAEGAGGASLAFTASGPFERLAGRLLGKTAPGYRNGTATAPKDRSTLLADLFTAANAEGYTGIDLGTVTNAGSTGFLEYAPYKVAAEAVTEVASGAAGPDWLLRFQEPQAVAGGTRLALVDIAAAVGQDRPDAVFEYGVGRRNVVSYRRAVTYELLNAGYGLAPADRPTAATVSATDSGSIATYGRHEGLVPSDLATDAMRQALVDEHVRVRKAPRQVVTFTPARADPQRPGRVPAFGVDYKLGDSVTFRAVNPVTKVVRVNATLRVYAVDFSIDAEGAATPSVSLTVD